MERSFLLKYSKNFAELCCHPSVLWEVELAKTKIGYLYEALSEQSVEGASWGCLVVYCKMKGEKNDLNMKFLIKKERELRYS